MPTPLAGERRRTQPPHPQTTATHLQQQSSEGRGRVPRRHGATHSPKDGQIAVPTAATTHGAQSAAVAAGGARGGVTCAGRGARKFKDEKGEGGEGGTEQQRNRQRAMQHEGAKRGVNEG